jgi:UDPglucose 6-dehydrogenase
MFLIAGYGYVGKAVQSSILKAGWSEIVIDPAIFPTTWEEAENIDGVIICVATPQGFDGSCDYSNVLEVLSHVGKNTPVLIKSTISLEAWYQIREHYPDHQIAFSPEFLTAKNAIKDYADQGFVILSGDNIHFWQQFFRGTVTDNILICKPEEAILTKYASNAFLAVKVGFFNHIYDLANLIGVDYEKIRENLGQRKQIGLNHTEITPERGWGGHCFPKDTSALMSTATDYKYDMKILRAAIEYNNEIREGGQDGNATHC